MRKFLTLNDITAYKTAFSLSNYVWGLIIKWDYFSRDTIGKQFVRAVDSIAANIAEGFNRYYKKEKIQFYRYSFGSIGESLDWNEKAKARNMLKPEEYERIFTELKKLPKELNHLINFTNEKLKK